MTSTGSTYGTPGSWTWGAVDDPILADDPFVGDELPEGGFPGGRGSFGEPIEGTDITATVTRDRDVSEPSEEQTGTGTDIAVPENRDSGTLLWILAAAVVTFLLADGGGA